MENSKINGAGQYFLFQPNRCGLELPPVDVGLRRQPPSLIYIVLLQIVKMYAKFRRLLRRRRPSKPSTSTFYTVATDIEHDLIPEYTAEEEEEDVLENNESKSKGKLLKFEHLAKIQHFY